MTATVRPLLVSSQGPSAADAAPSFRDRVRDQVAVRYRRLDDQPRVLDLLADVLVAAHEALHGVASLTAAPLHTPDDWREILRGERSMPLVDLCRLAVAPTREAGEAVDAILRELARARGCRVVPFGVDGSPLAEATARHASASASLVAGAVRALADGRVERHEVEELRPVLEQVKETVADVEAAMESAR